jgi:hypothetical protein
MKVLLISANTERINMPAPPLGLQLVAAATRRAGHDVTFLDLLSEPEPVRAIQRALAACTPAVIGISVRNIDDQDMRTQRFLLEPVKAVVAECRAGSDAPIVLGGAGYSMFPDAVLDYLGADFGIGGRGTAPQGHRDPNSRPGCRGLPPAQRIVVNCSGLAHR